MQHGRTGEVYYEGKCMSFSEPGFQYFIHRVAHYCFTASGAIRRGELFNFNLNLIITD